MAVISVDNAILTIGIFLVYLTTLAIYRLFVHPLSKVPGPRLAALTSWHEFYFDCVKNGGGQHAFEMRKMHDVYGSCIRINPWEVHIDGQADPAFWDVLYSNSNKLDKDSFYYDGFGSGLSAVSTRSSDLHRVRRGAMSSYFSMSNVRKYEPVVAGNVSELLHRLKKSQENNQVVNLADAYRCLAMDVVNSFAVPEPRKMLEVPDFGKGFNGLMRDFSRLIALQRHLLIVFPVVKAIPDWLTVRMDPTGASKMLVDYMRSFETQTRKVVERHGKPPPGQAMSVLDAIYTSAELDRRDKVVGRIVEEAQNVVGAGTETTGATLTNLTYHLLINPPMLTKLRDELSTAANNSTSLLDYRTLEKLPYLQACINEALRLCCPVTGRLPRVNPRAPTTYTDPNGTTYTFPAGTVMSMSMPDLHFNASIFPDPHLFRPERWLESSSEQQAAMQRFFVPFGKGSRNCLGMEVAKMELALTAGNVFRELGGKMALWETSARDVGWAYDFFAPYVPADSPGLRVKVV